MTERVDRIDEDFVTGQEGFSAVPLTLKQATPLNHR
jgi:hypothetical protein